MYMYVYMYIYIHIHICMYILQVGVVTHVRVEKTHLLYICTCVTTLTWSISMRGADVGNGAGVLPVDVGVQSITFLNGWVCLEFN